MALPADRLAFRLRSPLSMALVAAALGGALAAPAAAQQLQVYVLCGQSNMQGHAKVSTLDYMADDPASRPLLAKMRAEDGTPRVLDDVWIAYRTGGRDGDAEVSGKLGVGYGARRNAQQSDDKIGPEYTFGIRMAEAHDAPVLLIKAAWGGKSLHTDFRPPSAGPFEWRDDQLANLEKRGKDVAQAKADKQQATGRYYRSTIEFVRKVLADLPSYCPDYDAAAGHELAGFVWFQGWNDMVARDVYPQRDQPGGYDAYSECLGHFIRDVRKDLDAPDLPFVIGVMGVGGPIEDVEKRAVHHNFREAMAAPARDPEFAGTVLAVRTAPFWATELDAISAKLGKVSGLQRQLRQNKGPNADGSMDKAAQQAYVAKFRAELLTDEEERAWQRGASNGGYHYLGCGKTMAGIGVAFADALLKAGRR